MVFLVDFSITSYNALAVLLVLTLLLLMLYVCRQAQLPPGFAPGPTCLPLLGNLLTFAKYPNDAFVKMADLSKEYGPIVGIKMGVYPAVLLNRLDLIKEALIRKSDKFISRPSFMYLLNQIMSKHGKVRGIIWADESTWKTLRKYTMHCFRDFGVGRRSQEERLQVEAEALCSELNQLAGKPADISWLIQSAVSNNVASICFGRRYDYNSPDFKKMMDVIRFTSKTASFANPLNFIPQLRFVYRPAWLDRVLRNAETADAFVDSIIEEHRETFDPDDIRDFVDLYLSKEKEQHGDDEAFSRFNMQRLVLDLFVAGTETTSSAMKWILLYFIRYPEVQRKCQEEVDRVIGSARPPSLADRQDMIFLEATMHEITRISNVAALPVPRAAAEDTEIAGYYIPKGTIILPNLYSIHMNPEAWKDPHDFIPERWIGADGKIIKSEHFIPYSVGPRNCLGEVLAKNELFLFSCYFLQRFNFDVVDKENPPQFDGVLGLTLSPKPFEVMITVR